jgi:hypothetical protein
MKSRREVARALLNRYACRICRSGSSELEIVGREETRCAAQRLPLTGIHVLHLHDPKIDMKQVKRL